jgi:hypothetical protein
VNGMTGQHRRAAVVDAIERVLEGPLRAVGDAAWTFRLGSSPAVPVTATLSGDWLTLRAEIAGGWVHGRAVPACAWELAEENSSIAGPAKLVLAPAADCVTRCADIPLSADGLDDLPTRLVAACASLEEANQSPGSRHLRREASRDAGGREESTPLADVVRLAGWIGTPRSDGRFSVPLDTAPVICSALVGRAGGSILVSTSIQFGGEMEEVSRRAVGMLLLKVGGAFRMVRGSIRDSEDGPVGALEVQLSDSPRPEELNHALAALSVAARHSVAELAAMGDPEIASEWCRRQQWPLPARETSGQHEFHGNERRPLCRQH